MKSDQDGRRLSIYLKDKHYRAVRKLMKERDMSLSAAIQYCIEETIGIEAPREVTVDGYTYVLKDYL